MCVYIYICTIILIKGGVIRGRNGGVIGWTEEGKVGDEVGIEVDLRSEKKEERSIRFIVDGKIQKCMIIGVGREIRFGVCSNPLLLFVSVYLIRYSSLYSVSISLY